MKALPSSVLCYPLYNRHYQSYELDDDNDSHTTTATTNKYTDFIVMINPNDIDAFDNVINTIKSDLGLTVTYNSNTDENVNNTNDNDDNNNNNNTNTNSDPISHLRQLLMFMIYNHMLGNTNTTTTTTSNTSTITTTTTTTTTNTNTTTNN